MRSTWPLLLLLLVGCSEPATTSSTSREASHDWPGFLGPTGNSVSTETGILSPWPENGPKILWHKELGIGYAMPSISQGRIFVFDRIRNRARLRAWDVHSTETLWTFEYPTDYRDMYGYNGGPRCCPVIDEDRVYTFGPEGILHCVRADKGELLWKVDTKARFGVVQNFFGVGSTPVVEGDLLLVMVGGSPPGSEAVSFEELRGNGSAVVAFDKRTGKVRYQVGDELASYASPVLATIQGKRYGLFFARGGLLGIDPKRGKVEFHYPWRATLLESVNASNPVVVDNRIFLTECYELGSALIEIRDNRINEVWTDREKSGRAKSFRGHWMTPIHVDGYIYGSSGRHLNEAELRCVELATGKVMWRQPGLTRSSLLLLDGHFICLGEDGWLRLIRVNPKKYEEVSAVLLKNADGQPLLEEPCWAAPIVSNGRLYVRGKDRLVCLELIPPKK